VNAIGTHEKQGQDYWFLNRRMGPYEWTNVVPKDDHEFQGLLKEEEPAAYHDMLAELPGAELEYKDEDFQVVTNEPVPDFAELAATALDNTGIDPDERPHLANNATANRQVAVPPAIVEANTDEVVHEISFDLPDAGLGNNVVPPDPPLQGDEEAVDIGADKAAAANLVVATEEGQWYPTQACRSAVGNQPYNAYAPRMTFLQLGETRAHRSVVEAIQSVGMSKNEQLHALIKLPNGDLDVDDIEHMTDTALLTESEDKIKVWGYIMTQYNLKPGLRKFGARGAAASEKELTQLHIMDTWEPMHPSQLGQEEKMRVLLLLLFLKEKQTGQIKGRACINGAPQRAYIRKEEAVLPTVSTAESTFITAAIAVSENRKVRCYDVPSAFVNTDVNEGVLMVLKGKLATMLLHIAPEVYQRYMTADRKGTPVLYGKLQKALYGLMRASLLFYRKLRLELEAHGFEVNPYDPCIANLESPGGKQLTVIWHVDYLMAMCKEDFKLTKFLCYLAKIYGTKLAMHTGREHDYLGMDMEFTSEGTLQVSMITYLKNAIPGFPEMITGKGVTPAADYLFTIQDKKETRPLEQERRTAFHHTVAQLLFMSTRSSWDIQTAVAFLTTRVKAPDEDDWGKLKRVLKYLNGTKHLKPTLSVEDLGLLKWYMDGSHNVHWDCKGHGGAMFMIGRGSTSSYSRKIKLNTRSSTETELLMADMYMPDMLWSLNFIRGQGYEAE
jgi:hypothetical protein